MKQHDDSKTWYRGNTHTHTTRSDGDAEPEFVAKWYHDRDYNFLIITDHNKFIAPETVKLPENKRDDFILIPGEEISGNRTIHTTAMGIDQVAQWKYGNSDRSKIVQFQVDEAIKAGGTPILNHPNFHYAVSATNILPVKNLHLFELFNGHPSVHNHGDQNHPSTEEMWDYLLTEGMRIFAVAADDAHHYDVLAPNKANPGRGWVMVQAATLDEDEIIDAMLAGDFYASTGVFLESCEMRSATYAVEVDARRTKQELACLPSSSGKYVENGTEGFRIEFIGPNGDVLETVSGEQAQFSFDASLPYVRAKVTYTRKHPGGSGFEEYYAWGQPVFGDE